MTKLTITNTDPDNPDDERVIEELGLELPADAPQTVPAAFADAILTASENAPEEAPPLPVHAAAQAFLKSEHERISKQLKEQYGLNMGGGSPWAYKPKPKDAYNLWKRAVPLFKELPQSLDWSVIQLAAHLDKTEANFDVTRDMMYDQLNGYAVKDLRRALEKLGVRFELRLPVTIASLRQQFIERRDALQGKAEEQFKGEFVIRGNKVWINGNSYAIQRAPNGARRVRYGSNGWLNVEALKDFCTR
ncbi:hypothetical protein [Aurantiacibacter hainanensis]|uniref:hypothetical protein n=1 Tax=Aurantiacibacter hainanensis TaxID=3076114 RepID=UPI0030C6C96C